MLPVMQKLGNGKDDPCHWYAMCLNLKAQRFEVLDSMRGEESKDLMEHAGVLMNNIKASWLVNYGGSKHHIEHFKLKCINVPKQSTL